MFAYGRNLILFFVATAMQKGINITNILAVVNRYFRFKDRGILSPGPGWQETSVKILRE